MNRPLAGWLTAQVISATGTRLSLIAIPWFVLTTTGSATRTGVVAFAEMTPYVLVKALGGPMIDRLGARRVSVVCDGLSVVAVGAIPLLYGLGRLPFPALLVLVAFAGAFRGPGDGAKQALVPRISAASGTPLERMTGLANATDRTAGMAGSAAGGVLIALIGAPFALIIDAASFAVAALLIAVTAPGRDGGSVVPDQSLSYLGSLATGSRYVHRDRMILVITGMVALTNLLDQAYLVVLLPAWALHSGGGPAVLGLILAVWSAAAVTGSLVAAAVGARMPRFITYLVAFLIAGAPRFVVLAFDVPLVAVLVVGVIGGIASGFLNPILGAVLIERVPPELYGRVSSLTSALCWSTMPLGGLVAGWLIAGFTLSPALIVAGAGYFVATMLPVLVPDFRGMDRSRPVQHPDEEITDGIRPVRADVRHGESDPGSRVGDLGHVA